MNKIYNTWQSVRRLFARNHRHTYSIDDPLQHLPPHIRADLPPWHEPAPRHRD